MARRFNIPLYINHQTHNKLDGNLEGVESIFNFKTGNDFSIGNIKLHPFSVPHDAADPVGFAIQYRTYRIGIALDLGCATHLVKEKLKKSNLIILESNYDHQLLKSGPYPWTLKQRLQSRHGHLSNQAAGELLAELIHPELKHVILAHLSQTNNQPQLVYKQAKTILDKASDNHIQLSVAQQRQAGPVIKLNQDQDN
jgi:phosphoribosyl 1,2-cyclic phosphodiesterase